MTKGLREFTLSSFLPTGATDSKGAPIKVMQPSFAFVKMVPGKETEVTAEQFEQMKENKIFAAWIDAGDILAIK